MTYKEASTGPVFRLLSRILPKNQDIALELRFYNKLAYWREALKRSPLPPTKLMAMVQGNHEAEYYVAGGRRATETILETLEKSYVPLRQFRTVLDFGCGSGRVLRHWKSLARSIELHGTDYNPELVAWASRLLPFAKIAQNSLEPPLPYSDNYFDFVYALSTFTHWDIKLQHTWMKDFLRVLKPNGYILFTVHGDYYLPRLPKEYQEEYKHGRPIGPALGPTIVGTNAYASFNPHEHVRDELLQDFELVEYFRRASRGTPWQDVYLARKPPR